MSNTITNNVENGTSNLNKDNNSETILTVKDLEVAYGAVKAVQGVSFEIKKGEILTLVGSNGAGKTTILKTISGLIRPRSGAISYNGNSILSMQPHLIVKQKLIQVPEGRGIFLNLTVEENLDLGAWTSPSKIAYQKNMERSFTLFPRLKERLKQNAGTLSGGELQMLAMGRALMSEPKLLLLDEPSLGLAPQMIEKIFETVQLINREGVSILLVEQNALQALQIADHAVVLETGKVVLAGLAKDLLKSDEIRKSYLGEM